MLAKQWRLRSESEFRAVYRRGRKVRLPHFSVYFVIDRRITTVRLAVVVAKRVAKLATRRNRLKRRVWAALGELRHRLPTVGFVGVIVAQAGAPDLTFQAINQELGRLRFEPQRPSRLARS